MTILVDWEIEKLIKETNAIAPYDPSLLNPSSIDVLLGNEIKVETPKWKQPFIAWTFLVRGMLSSDFWEILNGCQDEFLTVDITKGYRFNCGEFILACTKEVFNLPDSISCEFRLKSSRAREGFDHLFAVWVDPGFNDSVLTLELKNSNRYRKLNIFAGLKIGQIIFHHHEACIKSYRQTGRYNGDRTVQTSRG